MCRFAVVCVSIFHCACGLNLLQLSAELVGPNEQFYQNDAWESVGSSCKDYHPGPCRQVPTSNCTKYQLPTFFYAGPPHSGSSSFAWELNLHDQISYGRHKEHVYLSSFGDLPGQLENRSFHDYTNEFHVDCEVKHTFDATSNLIWLANEDAANCTRQCMKNLWHAPGVAAIRKLQDTFSGAKVIMMFRDPLDMIYSGANGFQAAVSDMLKQRWRTCYADSVEKWLQVFPRNKFFFIDAAQYFKYPRSVLKNALKFLELEPRRFTDKELAPYGRRRNAKLIPTARERESFHADEFNLECKLRLERLTGLRFNWK